MSKFVDKLQLLSKSSAPSIGFHPAVSELKSSAMLLIAALAGVDAKGVGVVADSKVDAWLALSGSFTARIIRKVVDATGDVPFGVFVKGMSENKINELVSSGCDFMVFDVKMPGVSLHKEGIGKFLMIEPSLEQGLVRAINNLDIDGVFINRAEESFITVEHLLIYQRFSDLVNKPVIIILPSLIMGAELSNLWQIGIAGVVAPPSQPTETLAELRKMIDNLPQGGNRRRGNGGVILPHYGGGVDIEEEEEEEEEEEI